MCKPRFGLLLVLLSCMVVTGGSTFPSIPQLHGAWKLVHSSLAGRDTTIINSSPQPGLVIFTERHYSLMYVEGSAPRVPFADPARPTDAERLRAYDTFVGHSGSYSVVDSIIQMHIVIAKHPSMMGTELRTSFAQFAYRILADTLWLGSVRK